MSKEEILQQFNKVQDANPLWSSGFIKLQYLFFLEHSLNFNG